MKFPSHRILVLALASLVATVVAYQFSSPYRIQIARGDSAYVSDFWDLETGSDGNTFRWSKAESKVIFHNAGQILPTGRPLTLELRLASARPPGVDPPQVHVALVGDQIQDIGSFTAESVLSARTFTIDPSLAGSGDWTVEISSDTFRPPSDARDLGIMLRRVTLRAQDSGSVLSPPFPTVIYAVLIPLFVFLFAAQAFSLTRLKQVSLLVSTGFALCTIILLGAGLALYREQTVLYLPFLFITTLALGCWGFARELRSVTWPICVAGRNFHQAAFLTGVALLTAGEILIWITDLTWLGAAFLIAGALSIFLSMQVGSESPEPIRPLPLSSVVWVAILGITAIGLAMRVYRLDQVLFGLFRDETRLGLLGLRVLNNPNYRPIYEGPPISQSGMLIYLLALSFSALGANIFSLRLVGALAGALTVPLVWRLARDWFPLSADPGASTSGLPSKAKGIMTGGSVVALVAAFGLAIGTMHVYYSRFTLPYVESPLLSIPAYILLVRGLKSGRWQSYALAGLFFGATQYASQVSRVSIAVGAFIVLDEIASRRALPRNFLRGAGALTISALITLTPLLSYVIQHADVYLARTQQVSLFNDQSSAGQYPVTLLWNNVVAYAEMFNVVGDSHGGHVVPTRPEFDPVFGVLFLIGALYAVARWRESAYRRVLFWLFASLLPGLLSIEAPAPLRVLETPAPTFVLAGIGAVWILLQVTKLPRMETLRVANLSYGISATTLVLAALALFSNARVYFGELGNDPRLWDKNQALSTPLGAALNEWMIEQRIPAAASVYAPDWFLGANDDLDVLQFATNGIQFSPLSGAPAHLFSPTLMVRPNVVGYWKAIIARQPDSAKILPRWTDQDTQTLSQIHALAGARGITEYSGPPFPDSGEPTFWLYVVQ